MAKTVTHARLMRLSTAAAPGEVMASGFKDAVARISAVMGLRTLSGCAVRSIAVPTIAPRVTVIIVVAKDLSIVPSQVTKVRMPHIPSTVAPKQAESGDQAGDGRGQDEDRSGGDRNLQAMEQLACDHGRLQTVGSHSLPVVSLVLTGGDLRREATHDQRQKPHGEYKRGLWPDDVPGVTSGLELALVGAILQVSGQGCQGAQCCHGTPVPTVGSLAVLPVPGGAHRWPTTYRIGRPRGEVGWMR